jgi:tight adherence protein B
MLWVPLAFVGLGLWLIHDSLLPARPRAPRGPSRTFARLRDWLVQTGVPVTPRTFLLVSLAGAIVGATLAHLVFGWPIVDLCGALSGGALYPLGLRGRHARQRQAVLRALPDAIDRLRDSLASVPLDVALARLGTEAGPGALQPTFRQLGNELAVGVSFAEAVQRWADGLADRTADQVASALILHDRAGAQRFSICLDQLAASLRANLALRDRVAAARTRIVLQARVLLLLPIPLLLILRSWQPVGTQAFGTPTGQLVLAAGVLFLALGYGLMLLLARLPEDEREAVG